MTRLTRLWSRSRGMSAGRSNYVVLIWLSVGALAATFALKDPDAAPVLASLVGVGLLGISLWSAREPVTYDGLPSSGAMSDAEVKRRVADAFWNESGSGAKPVRSRPTGITGLIFWPEGWASDQDVMGTNSGGLVAALAPPKDLALARTLVRRGMTIVIVAILAMWLPWLWGAAGPTKMAPRLTFHLVQSTGLLFTAGSVLMLGHGFVAGARATLLAGLSGSLAVAIVDGLGIEHAPPYAVVAGVLVGVVTEGKERMEARRMAQAPGLPWWPVLGSVALGVLVGALILLLALLFRRAAFDYARGGSTTSQWAEVPVWARGTFGGVLGLLSGGVSAFSFQNGASFASWPREARQRTKNIGVRVTLAWAAIGAGLAASFTQQRRLIDGAAHGVLSALVVLMFYLAPTMFVGLRLDAGRRARISLVGCLVLSGLAYVVLGELMAKVDAGAMTGLFERLGINDGTLAATNLVKLHIESLVSEMGTMALLFIGSALFAYSLLVVVRRVGPGLTRGRSLHEP